MVLFSIPDRAEREAEQARCGSKRRDLSYARHAAAAAAYSRTAVPVSEIARILNRDHSSIRSGIRRCYRRLPETEVIL